jgi:hypothetical protein
MKVHDNPMKPPALKILLLSEPGNESATLRIEGKRYLFTLVGNIKNLTALVSAIRSKKVTVVE